MPETAKPDQDSEFPATNLPMLAEMTRGIDKAWHTFFDLYGPIVHRYTRHAGLRVQDADEVLSNVMSAFVRRLKNRTFTVDRQRGRFRDYFKAVTNRAIGAQRRRLARSKVASDPIEAEDPRANLSDYWAELERAEMLRVSLERLYRLPSVRARDIQVFKRYVLAGEPAETVASDLGLSISRVYAIKHEMTGELRKIIRNLGRLLGVP